MRGTHPERALERLVHRAAPLDAGARVLVACSGGPDSVALASLVARIARTTGAHVALGHVNHGIRSSAWQDEAVALSVGARLGIPVLVAAVEAAPDEASLREARYTALTALARRAGARAVLTAHTAEDQTETVLLALFRGAGPGGLAGMPARRSLAEGIELVRPLLRCARARLHQLELRRTGLPYARDPSNVDPRYRRTGLRRALTGLRADFPGLDEAVARCAELAEEEARATPRAAARRELREALRAQGLLRDVPFERIEAALDASSPGRRVHLRSGLELVTRPR